MKKYNNLLKLISLQVNSCRDEMRFSAKELVSLSKLLQYKFHNLESDKCCRWMGKFVDKCPVFENKKLLKKLYCNFIEELPESFVVYRACNNFRCINLNHLVTADKSNKEFSQFLKC